MRNKVVDIVEIPGASIATCALDVTGISVG